MDVTKLTVNKSTYDAFQDNNQLILNLDQPTIFQLQAGELPTKNIILRKNDETISLSDWLGETEKTFGEQLDSLYQTEIAVAGEAEYYQSLTESDIEQLKTEFWSVTPQGRWWCRVIAYGCQIPL